MFLLFNILIDTYKQFIDDESAQRAGALAFNLLLALVPLMTVSLTILTAFPNFSGLKDQMSTFIVSHLVSDFANTIQAHFDQFAQQTRHLSMMGLVSFLATAILMIFNLENAFNRIWRVSQGRHSVTGVLLYWGVLTLLPLLLGAGVMMVSLLSHFLEHDMSFLPHYMGHVLLPIIPYSLTFIVFSLLYIALPNRKVPALCALTGGLFAALLFEFAKYAFTLYIHYFPTYHLIYGAIAAIPLFLIWLYLCLVIALAGATLSRVLHTYVYLHAKDGQ